MSLASLANRKLSRYFLILLLAGVFVFGYACLAHAAISFVAHKESTVNASSITLTQADTGSNNLIVTAILGSVGDSLSSVTHAGQNENFIASRSTGGNRFLYLYYATSSTALVNATTAVTFSNGPDYHEVRQTQYEGVAQSSTLDDEQDQSFPSDTSSTFSITNNDNGDWIVMGTQNNGGFEPTTCVHCDIHSVKTSESTGISDSSSTGSFDMSVRWSGSAASNAIRAAFKSAGSPTYPVNIASGTLDQRKLSGTTSLSEGTSTTETGVWFQATLQSSSSDGMRLQVEVSTSSSFTNPWPATSSVVHSTELATTTVTALPPGTYYWRARAIDDTTNATTSAWQEFDTPGVADFTVALPNPSGIVFVSHTESTVNASSITLTQTDTGNSNLIVTAILGSTSDILSSVKHAGQNENFIASRSTGGNRYLYLYYATSSTALANATTTITFSSSDYHEVRQTEYEGVSQSAPFVSKNDASFASDTSSTFPISNNNSGNWMVMGTQNNGGFQPTTCLNCDIHSVLTSESTAISDSSSTGSFDMSVRWASAAASNAILATFRPSGDPTSYYAQIKNTDTRNLRQDPNTSSSILKTLPGDWTVYVSSTVSATGTTVISNGYKWFNVVDKTDGVNGWMTASSSDGTVYLSNVTSTSQSDFEAKASSTLSSSSTRAEKIVDAVNWYWDHVSSTDSLYNTGFSYLFSATSSASSTWIFPKELFFAMASRESGSSSNAFNNEIVSKDYGHGIMQLTPYQVFAHEPTSTGDWINNTEDVPTPGSHIAIPPCAMIATTTYINCYMSGGTGNNSPKPYKDYGYSNGSTTYEFYANTTQSIYANIKDGLNVLKNKYTHTASSTATASSTVFQPYEREWLRATWGYNGLDLGSTYLSDVAKQLDSLHDYFSSTGTKMVATSSFTVDLANKLRIADAYKEEVVVFSPVELSITDSQGRTTGMVDGKVEEDISDSAYNPQRKAVAVFFSNDAYAYNIKGIGNGTYGFLIDHPQNGSKTTIYGPAIPIRVGEVHTYTVDWNALAKGENGVTVKIDSDGNGTIDKTVQTDGSFTGLTLFAAPVPTEGEAVAPPAENTQALCSDGIDNDQDGATDLADLDCKAFIPVPPPPPVYVPPVTVATSTPNNSSSTTNMSSTIDL